MIFKTTEADIYRSRITNQRDKKYIIDYYIINTINKYLQLWRWFYEAIS
jgi:hypothetical protein